MAVRLITRTPLGWPTERRRTFLRRRAPFAGKLGPAAALARARLALIDAIERLGAVEPVLSTDVDLTLDLAPSEPDDPGATLAFRFDTRPHLITCDGWDRLADNVMEIALRLAEAGRLDRSAAIRFLAADALIPLVARPWRQILGFADGAPTPSLAAVERAFRTRARQVHPDAGGTMARMAELNAARDAARAELSGANP